MHAVLVGVRTELCVMFWERCRTQQSDPPHGKVICGVRGGWGSVGWCDGGVVGCRCSVRVLVLSCSFVWRSAVMTVVLLLYVVRMCKKDTSLIDI